MAMTESVNGAEVAGAGLVAGARSRFALGVDTYRRGLREYNRIKSRVAGSPGRRVAGSPGRRVAGSPGRPICVRRDGHEPVRMAAAPLPSVLPA